MFLSGLWKKFPHKARHFRSNWTFYSQLQQQMERMCRSYLRPVTTAPDCPEKVDNKNYSRRSHTALLGDPKLWNIACKVNKSDRGIVSYLVNFENLTNFTWRVTHKQTNKHGALYIKMNNVWWSVMLVVWQSLSSTMRHQSRLSPRVSIQNINMTHTPLLASHSNVVFILFKHTFSSSLHHNISSSAQLCLRWCDGGVGSSVRWSSIMLWAGNARNAVWTIKQLYTGLGCSRWASSML